MFLYPQKWFWKSFKCTKVYTSHTHKVRNILIYPEAAILHSSKCSARKQPDTDHSTKIFMKHVQPHCSGQTLNSLTVTSTEFYQICSKAHLSPGDWHCLLFLSSPNNKALGHFKNKYNLKKLIFPSKNTNQEWLYKL